MVANTGKFSPHKIYVIHSRFARELKLTANEKTLKQVKGKLTIEEEKYRAIVQLTYGVIANP